MLLRIYLESNWSLKFDNQTIYNALLLGFKEEKKNRP